MPVKPDCIVVVHIVERAALFIIHISQVLFVAFKEHLVASHYVGCLVDAVVQTLAQVDYLFHAIGWEEGIAVDVVALLPDTITRPAL